MKSKFGQLSVALKLIVIWFFLLALGSFWRFGIDIQTKHVLDLGPLIGGILHGVWQSGSLTEVTNLECGRCALCF